MEENQVAPEPQVQQQAAPEAPAPAPADAYQKRIDELTQRLNESTRQREEAYKTVAELAARDAALAQQHRAVPQAPEDPLAAYREKMDPTALEAMSQMQAAMERKFAQQYAQLEASFGVQQIGAVATSVPGLPPQVVQHAQKLYQEARQAGHKPSHDEALNFAIGDYVRKGGKLNVAPQAPQYGSPNAVLPGTPPAPRTAALPANINQLPRAQQLALMRAHYENEPF